MSDMFQLALPLPSEIPELDRFGLHTELTAARNRATGEIVRLLKVHGPGVAAHQDTLKDIGFRFDTVSGAWFSQGPIDRTRLIMAFGPIPAPEPPAIAPQVQREAAPITGQTEQSEQRIDRGQAKPSKRGAIVLGSNGDQSIVYRTESGERYFRTVEGDEVFESDLTPQDGVLFLRVREPGDLIVVCKGILAPAVNGRTMSGRDFVSAAAAIREGVQFEMPAANILAGLLSAGYAMIEEAETPEQGRLVASRLHRFTENSFSKSRSESDISFPVAAARHELSAGHEITVSSADSAAIDTLLAQIAENRASTGGLGRSMIRVTNLPDGVISDEFVRKVMGDIPTQFVIEASQIMMPPIANDVELLISVGAKRPRPVDISAIPMSVFDVAYVSEPEALYGWVDETMEAMDAANAWFAAIEKGEVRADEIEPRTKNRWQVPYRPMSQIGKPSFMVPINLANSHRIAQERFLARHPEGVDVFVANKLKRPVSSLGYHLLPEQIDTVGLVLDDRDRRRGGLVGNDTGTGKGRVAMAVALAEVLAGKKVLVVTEAPVGIGTLIRDLANVGGLSSVSIAMMNAGTEVIEAKTGRVVMPKRTLAETQELFAPGGVPSWPKGVDMVFASFTQFNRELETGWRTQWLQKVSSPDIVPILDESHKIASPDSNSANNFVGAMAKCDKPTYLSATYAGSGDKIGPYYTLVGAEADPSIAEILPRVISNSGEAGHEEFANLIAEDGVFIRLEHNLSDVGFELRTSANAAENRAKIDQLAPVNREMMNYLGLVRRAVDTVNIGQMATLKTIYDQQKADFAAAATGRLGRLAGAQQGDGPNARIAREQAQREAMTRTEQRAEWRSIVANGKYRAMSIGSPFYRIMRSYSAALQAVDEAGIVADCISDWKEGRKSIIVVGDTGESVMRDVLSIAKELGIEAPKPTLKDLLKKAVRGMGLVANRQGERMDVTTEEVRNKEKELREVASNILGGVVDVATEAFASDEFAVALAETKKDITELAREWYDAAVPGATSMSLSAVETALGKEFSESEKATIKKMIDVSIEDGFMVGTGGIADINLVIKERVAQMVDSPDVMRAQAGLYAMIDQLPDTPLSFIDITMDRLRAAGIKIGEITGRSLRTDNAGNIVPRPRETTESARDKFNSGVYDCVLVNIAGASMIDLHASSEFKDQRQRVVRFMQTLSGTQVKQTIGRGHRYGAVVPARVAFHINGMPAEVKMIAAQNQHLARLNANLAAMRRHPLMVEVVPPLLTADGDIAVARYLLENEGVAQDLGIDAPKDYLEKVARLGGNHAADDADDAEAVQTRGMNAFFGQTRGQEAGIASIAKRDNRRLANEVLSRIIIWPSSQQAEALGRIDAHVRARMEEKAALGLDVDGVQRIAARHVSRRGEITLETGDVHLPEHLRSAFQAPLKLELIAIRSSVQPMRSQDVVNAISRAIADGQDRKMFGHIEQSRRLMDSYIAEAQERGLEEVRTFQIARLTQQINLLETFHIGAGITIPSEEGMVNSIVVGFEAGVFDESLKVAVPGQANPQTVSMTAIRNNPALYQPAPGIAGAEKAKTLRAFNAASEQTKITPNLLLTGNTWRAIQGYPGKIVSIADDNGRTSRGVIVPKSYDGAFVLSRPILTPLDAELAARQDSLNVTIPLMGAGGDLSFSKYVMNLRMTNGRASRALTVSVASSVTGAGKLSESALERMGAVNEAAALNFVENERGIVGLVYGSSAKAQIIAAFEGIRNRIVEFNAILENPNSERKDIRRAKTNLTKLERSLEDGVKLPIGAVSFVDDKGGAGASERKFREICQFAIEQGYSLIKQDAVNIHADRISDLGKWIINGGVLPDHYKNIGVVEKQPAFTRQERRESSLDVDANADLDTDVSPSTSISAPTPSSSAFLGGMVADRSRNPAAPGPQTGV